MAWYRSLIVLVVFVERFVVVSQISPFQCQSYVGLLIRLRLNTYSIYKPLNILNVLAGWLGWWHLKFAYSHTHLPDNVSSFLRNNLLFNFLRFRLFCEYSPSFVRWWLPLDLRFNANICFVGRMEVFCF